LVRSLGYDPADRRLRCGEFVLAPEDRVPDHFQQQLELIPRKRVIVTTTSSSYLGIFELWLRTLPRLEEEAEIVVACLDEGAARRVEEIGGCRVLRRFATTRADIWVARLEVVIDQVDATDVIHSDADAFWLRDPTPFLEEGPGSMAFSIDHGLGANDKGFALCCGFYAFTRTEANVAFLRRWLRRTIQLRDDQLAVNDLYETEKDVDRFRLLPYSQFQRCNSHFPVVDPPVVWHPWLDRDHSEKLHVWTTVLDGRPQDILHAFYRRRQSLVLDARELNAILTSDDE